MPKAPKGKMLIELSSVVNPDYDLGSRQRGQDLPKEHKTVRDLQEARKEVTKYIRMHDLGGGNWSGGNVYDDAGLQVARISYNGRVWEPGQGHKEIHIAHQVADQHLKHQ